MARQNYELKDGTKVSGVTTIISQNLGWGAEGLKYWAWNEGREGRDYRDSSKSVALAGTIAHYLIDCDIKKHDPELETRYPNATPGQIEKGKNGYMNYLSWKGMMKIKIIMTEVPLISEAFQFGATIDCIAMVKKSLCILDWKTGKAVYPNMMIQLAAYKHVWEEVYPKKLLSGGFHLLHIERENAAFHHHHWGELDDAWQAFLLLLRLNELKKKLKG